MKHSIAKWSRVGLHLGTNFEHGWIRALAIVGLAVLLVGIQMGLEYLLYPELW